MATLFQVPQFFDNNGAPLSAGHVYWFQATTSTPKLTWKDAAETTPHVLTYITLDADGRWPGGACFIRGSYKLVVKNSTESETYISIDNISEYNQFDFTGLTASIADLNSTTTTAKLLGGSLLTYTVVLADRGQTIMVNALTAAGTINLPSAVSVGNTFKVWIKKTDLSTNTVTIVPFGAQTIDGCTSKVLYDYGDFIEVRSDGSNWMLGGSLIRGTIVSISSVTTLSLIDSGKIYNCDTTAGTFAVHLPVCNTVGRGYWVGVKKIDSSANTVTITPNGAETIDGHGTYSLDSRWQYVQLKTNGLSWFIVQQNLTSNAWNTGDVKTSYNHTQTGWVWMNNGTIGSVASLASSRANADTEDLYLFLWNTVSDAYCPVAATPGGVPSVGNRGISAAADWAADKPLQVPKVLGSAMISAGIYSTKNWLIGEHGGLEAHTMLEPEVAAHYHTYQNVQVDNISPSFGAGASHRVYSITSTTGTGSGTATPFSIFQPSAAFYFLIKL